MALNQLSLLSKFDRVAVLTNGVVVQQGHPAELTETPGPLRQLLDDAGTGRQQKDAEGDADAEGVLVQMNSTASDDIDGRLVQVEKKAEGAVSTSVVATYIRSMGVLHFTVCVLLSFIAYGALGFSDRWLAIWIKESQDARDSVNGTSDGGLEPAPYAVVYASAVFVFMLFVILSSTSFSYASVKASRGLHNDCVTRLLRAPVSFFETTPSGRILSRLSTDLSTVDVMLAQFSDHMIAFISQMTMVVVIILIIAPPMAGVFAVAGIVYGCELAALDRTKRQLKRMANNAMSPVLTLLGEMVQGRLLLRVTGCARTIHTDFSNRVDNLQKCLYLETCVVNWGLLVSHWISFFVSAATAIYLLVLSKVSEEMLGLCLSYALMVPYFLLHFMFVSFVLATSIASLERLLQCSGEDVPQEPEWHLPSDSRLPEKWPHQGAVSFESVSLTYRPGLPPALQQLTFDIRPGERIGIVGRTGAGKSSLLALLFRIVDASSGVIKVDNEPVSSVGLHTLRRRMAVIPQEPLLLSGTVRDNVDPFGVHSDDTLASALEKVGFPADLLDRNVGGDDGHALSHGQHQLVALARALLRDVRVVVLDEPTSNVDAATDRRVQAVLREELRGCTVFTVAHRLATVLSSDRIMVLDGGRLVELGPADELMDVKGGHFARLAHAAGLTDKVQLG
eukprot:TRINITY_DN33033_c0_g1_i1.p2 TRINITY_DN33033_c0_g1~~TRINITY_DN33033_c0_g1_i1.p2  ORF type:complete len:677 (+),score=198.65 TRINITY_DN33033_c0_g1_i1:2068-4098(+)